MRGGPYYAFIIFLNRVQRKRKKERTTNKGKQQKLKLLQPLCNVVLEQAISYMDNQEELFLEYFLAPQDQGQNVFKDPTISIFLDDPSH